jgi:hypothetical protein
MTDELRHLLIEVRDRLETEGLMLGSGHESDLAIIAWDSINGLLGPDCPECEEQDLRTDGKVLVFPILQ